MLAMVKLLFTVVSFLTLSSCSLFPMPAESKTESRDTPFSYRNVVTIEGPRGTIRCPTPDPRTYTASLRAGFETSMPDVLRILEADVKSEAAFGAIVKALPRGSQDLAVLDYRLCLDFANGLLRLRTHQRFIDLSLKYAGHLPPPDVARPQLVKATATEPMKVHSPNRSVNIAIILGSVPQSVSQTVAGFMRRARVLLLANGYFTHFEFEYGLAEPATKAEKQAIIDKLFKRFEPEAPDYLVTVGTAASEFAREQYLGQIPIIFTQATDPIESRLVRPEQGLAPDSARGEIAGVTTGFPLAKRLDFLLEAFPDKRLGYIYRSTYPADVILKTKIETLAKAKTPPVAIVPIEVTNDDDRLTPAQLEAADVFFGWAYLDAAFTRLAASARGKPFIGADEYVIPRAVITTASDDYRIGEIAAEKLLFQNLLLRINLSDLPIEDPDLMKITANVTAAKELPDFVLPQVVIQNADLIIE